MKKHIVASHADLFRHMGNTIAKNKRVTLAVAKSRKEPAFFYTIGNQEKQLPELLIIGNFRSRDMCIILNTLSDNMLKDGSYQSGDPIDLGGEYPLFIYSATEEAQKHYTFQAGQFYANEDYKVMQVVIPDTKGCYPGDPKCHKDYQVPILRTSLSQGEIPKEDLMNAASAAGGVVKYYIVAHENVQVRYMRKDGYFSYGPDIGYFSYNEPDMMYEGWLPAGTLTVRFANYWHAYAHMLRLTKKEATTI